MARRRRSRGRCCAATGRPSTPSPSTSLPLPCPPSRRPPLRHRHSWPLATLQVPCGCGPSAPDGGSALRRLPTRPRPGPQRRAARAVCSRWPLPTTADGCCRRAAASGRACACGTPSAWAPAPVPRWPPSPWRRWPFARWPPYATQEQVVLPHSQSTHHHHHHASSCIIITTTITTITLGSVLSVEIAGRSVYA